MHSGCDPASECLQRYTRISFNYRLAHSACAYAPAQRSSAPFYAPDAAA